MPRRDKAIREVFYVAVDCSDRRLAEAVLRTAGRQDVWEAEFTPEALRFLLLVAETVASSIWEDEDRRVHVPTRVRAVARELMYSVERLDAPGILLAINPHARIPKMNVATIAELHRLARRAIEEELPTLVGHIFRQMVDYELIEDISKTAAPRSGEG
jgi:hypothetical protein